MRIDRSAEIKRTSNIGAAIAVSIGSTPTRSIDSLATAPVRYAARMSMRWWCALGLACGCTADEDAMFVQPGLDDPTARAFVRAGSWYPEDPEELDAEVEALLADIDAGSLRGAIAILTPHASLAASGPTAAEIYARVEVPDSIIVLAPDHWGDGEPTAIWSDGPWLIPGHAIAIDRELTDDLQSALPELVPDRVPFENHEEEMQLPYLQYLRPEVRLAGIAIDDNSRVDFPEFDVARIVAWGDALAELLSARAEAGESVLLITTTDLTHHETAEVAAELDGRLLEYVAALDVEGLHEYVTSESISICGEIPTAVMMATLRAMGRDSIEILARGDSVEALGDPTDVVGYPAAAAWR